MDDLPPITLTRRLPHSIDAEMALLGALLANGKSFDKVSEFLRPDHFSLKEHRLLFGALSTLAARNQFIDATIVKTWMMNNGGLEAVGGEEYLARLAAAAKTVINVFEYGRMIYDLAVRRELISVAEELLERAYHPDVGEQSTAMIERTEQALFDISSDGRVEGGFVEFSRSLQTAAEAAERAYKSDGAIAGVTTGFRDLDARLGGLHDSDLIILAGRPSMGKTALATNIAFNVARRNNTIGFFSLEMSREQLANRILGDEVRVPSDKIRRGLVTWQELERVIGASTDLGALPIFIDDTPAITMAGMRTRARRLKRKHGLGLLVVDYLQLIGNNPGRRFENRVTELSEITRGLKALAKELRIPVLALSQLSRAVESREDKRPQLSDLRESGTIEQDADVVMFIYREQYYLERAEPTQRPDDKPGKWEDRHADWQRRCEQVYGLADVIVAKQRHGAVGTVQMKFEGEFTRFSDMR